MAARTILFVAPPAAAAAVFPQLKEAGLEAALADSLAGALASVKKHRPCAVFARPGLPGLRIEELLAKAAEEEAFPPVIVFTDRGSAEDAQRFLSLGARDYWLEPLSFDKIRAALPRERQAPAAPAAPAAPGLKIIGNHPSVRRVLALAKQVAPSRASVLISGESGTGKELFAKYLHSHSNRAAGPFIAINCAALPEHLLESELFGHEKGAFTGAISRKPGKFELASGGTLLLDEITEMDLGLQAKLLRVLQEGELDRVGGTETVKVDVRVLATTNRNIEETVEAGKFRRDLFFRLNVIPLRLPALRERGEDIPLLAQYFVDNYTNAYGLPRAAFSDEARAWLAGYDWPGNVRELQNLMERAVLLAGQRGCIEKKHFLLDSDAWLPDELAEELDQAASAQVEPEPAVTAEPGGDLEKALAGGNLRLDEIERIAILKRLEQTEGNRTQAAELLGISVRTLRNKINEYKLQGLEVP
ncbi:MAG: sigma-54 dependent transcriptional regulator [Thermodesulfobacteriota bacterium]